MCCYAVIDGPRFEAIEETLPEQQATLNRCNAADYSFNCCSPTFSDLSRNVFEVCLDPSARVYVFSPVNAA